MESRASHTHRPMTRLLAATFSAVAGILWIDPGPAGAMIPKGATITLEPIASGLRAPIGAVHAGDGSGRLFVIDQAGRILIIDSGGNLLPTPFLDISAKLPALNPGFDERGLLGLAFHPDYETNGRFFVRHSAPRAGAPGEPCFGTSRGCHEEILAEYAVSAGDPNVADPLSETILFRVNKPQFNHNAGLVAFGPDGYLYFGLGDGGGAHDGLADMPPSHGPIGNGQNIDVPLGKILRIDVDSGTPYAIPPDNPFVGGPGLDEIFAYGLRNPYRFAFDSRPGGDGKLWLADVGQNQFEEIDHVVRGGNFGWVIREGKHCFDPFAPNVPPASCATTGAGGEPLIDPIVDYSHAEGGISITGGFVYRGPCQSSLQGHYIFGDFSASFGTPSGRLYYLVEPVPGSFEIREFRLGAADLPFGRYLKGFGEDEEGNLYVCSSTALAPTGSTGTIHLIMPEDCTAVPVVLTRLAVMRDAGDALLSWEVAEATDHLGFHVYRQAPDGNRVQLTDRLLSGRTAYEYRDEQAPAGRIDYWLAEITRSGRRNFIGPLTLPAAGGLPAGLTLSAPWPNPFLSSTTIEFTLPRDGRVRADVFDVHGRLVMPLTDAVRAAGEHAVAWNGLSEGGRPAPAGFYILRLEAGGESKTVKVFLSR
jgi:glucose/arabinose dehydrogenase